MNSADLLRQKRALGYGLPPSSESTSPDDRSFDLTEDENEMYHDGQKCMCSGEIRDGKFIVESIQPVEGPETETL